ncbi:MAG: hypothetical protein JW814_05700 [Candidatus Krumholzibacteriota bacterium]|nr:hypothetical protein [Candidatus Krumholzibacteriota bacterium]
MKKRSIIAIFMFFVIPLNLYSYELISIPPDTVQSWESVASHFHLYGTEDGEFDISISFPVFNGIFNLYVTDNVAAWDSTSLAEFILKVVDSDSTNSDDIFPLIWDYYCYDDTDQSYGGVCFDIDIMNQTYTKINLALYDINDFDCAGSDSDPPPILVPLSVSNCHP